MPEPLGARPRPIGMNRRTWVPAAAVAAVAAVLVAVTGVSMLSTDRGREAFGFDGAYADADPKVLIIRYGDSGTCPSEAVSHAVAQQSDRVVVTLTRTPMPAGQACTSDYRAMLVRVALTAPLGSRKIVDGSRQQPVPLSTGTPPFG